MDLIAREVELSKGTLYLYFKSKDSLHLSLVRYRCCRITRGAKSERN